ncbi:MAG: hypothetical protein ACERKV_12415 [Clostridiaceae bacterium]
MQHIYNKKNHKKNGAALVLVLVTFLVICIFTAIISSIIETNLMQAKSQENSMKAYYLALSGSDLCFAALLQKGPSGDNDTLLYKRFNPTNVAPSPLTDTLTLDGGTVDITVTSMPNDAYGERWVEIKSIAKLDHSTTKKTVILQFQFSNPSIQKKS